MVDREEERSELLHLLDAGKPQLALLYGRRRVGKTYLLTHVWPEETTFYFTASSGSPEQNRQQLVAEVGRWTGTELDAVEYPTWRSIFRLLLDLRAPEGAVVVLDEFQYFGENQRELESVASELNAVWESRRVPRPFVLVLSGSAVRLMEALSAGGAPLHGRFAWEHRLQPFDYWHAGRMAGFRSLRERAMAYGVFGGVPRYLAAIRSDVSFEDNVVAAMLSPRGEVRTQVETALTQEQGLRDTTKYDAVLRAISGGRTEVNEIAQGAGVPNDTALRDKLGRLASLGYIESRRNLGARAKEPYRYRLADPAVLFYHTFVTRFETELARSKPKAVWRDFIEPRFDTYMGPIFERIVEQGYYRLHEAWRLPTVHEWGRWEGKDREGKPLEMDIASALTNGRVLTGQVKWNADPVPASVFSQHCSMVERLCHAGVKWAHEARLARSPMLFAAAAGFSDAFKAVVEEERGRGRDIVLWSLKDLFEDPRRKKRSRSGS